MEFDEGTPLRTSRKAKASLILGLCSFVACCLTGVPAIVLGILGLLDINNPMKRVTGKRLAIAGIVLGTLTTIVGVFLILFPQESREATRRASCENNLKQIALAMHNYDDAHGTFPPAARYDANGKPLLSWRVLILPYLEGQQGLYEQFHFDEPWDSPHNKSLADRMPRVFQCETAQLPSPSLTTYQVIVDPRSMFTGEPTGVPFSSVSDGSSATLLIVEAASPVPWTKPEDLSLASPDPLLGMGSKHPGSIVAVRADGSIRSIKTSGEEAISPQDLRALVTRDGHEEVAAP